MELDSRPIPAPPAADGRCLSAGIVAHNEETTIGGAIASLLGQALPPPFRLDALWVVASGCTDSTLAVVRQWMDRDARVQLVVQPERRGKATALREVFSRARGEYVILLNGDAVAEPGSVGELLRVAESLTPPFAVMARPEPELQGNGPIPAMLRFQWSLHHELHAKMLDHRWGNNLSDELLLVSRAGAPEIPPWVINDGGFFGVWLTERGGTAAYAPAARVRIEIPSTLSEHLAQRRRIRFGTNQIQQKLAVRPTTLSSFGAQHPAAAIEAVRNAAASVPRGYGLLALLCLTELFSVLLSVRDRLPRPPDHVRWERIRRPFSDRSLATGSLRPPVRSPARSLHRSRAVLRIAAEFRTGIPVDDFVSLLPEEGPRTPDEAAVWLSSHPHLGRVESGRVYPATVPSGREREEESRAAAFMGEARALVAGPLGLPAPFLRCVAVTGSTAYGTVKPGDDVDIMLIVRAGSLWLVLALVWTQLRLTRRKRSGRPVICINFALDDRVADREFSHPHDLLYAREALTARVIYGEEFYAKLLGKARWMSERLPRLFSARSADPASHRATRPAPLPIRVLNAALFPLMMGYVQAITIFRNARLRARGLSRAQFRADAGYGRFTVHSARFHQLEEWYRSAESGQASEEEERSDRAGSGRSEPAPGGSVNPPAVRFPGG